MLPQSRTSQLLLEQLRCLGGDVEFGAAVTEVQQDAAGVTALVTRPAACGGATTTERVTASFLVGCDGGRSTVRKQLDVRLLGETLAVEPSVIADVGVDVAGRGLDLTRWHAWPFCARCLPVQAALSSLFSCRGAAWRPPK